ncbi:hypothetical protein BC941DRAFT_446360 [Chlamydoabsidia padenii]|nr:hypothetical protein BC941DRAFT_446360 [Chlamydoabsidia padenii]
MNTTGSYFDLCTINLQQKINALAKSFDAVLAQAVEESINPQLLREELLGTPALSSSRKVHPWNAFLHEEAKGVKLNKESIASLKRKYDEASEEEKQGYCKRMSWGPVDKRKAAKKIFKDMAQSSVKLLDLAVQSLVLVASPGSRSTVRKGQSFALGDEAARFLSTSAVEDKFWSSVVNPTTTTITNSKNNLRTRATEKLRRAYGAALGTGPANVQWSRVHIGLGPTYPPGFEYLVLDKWPHDVPTKKRMVDLTSTEHRKLLDGEVVFKRTKL